MLEIAGLQKSYGPAMAVDSVDLAVGRGQILGLLGPNGAGKTTLVCIVAGLRKADAGTVTVAGIDALRYPGRVRPLLGIAPQELGLYPTLSVRVNLGFFGELAGYRGQHLYRSVLQAAEAVGLADRLDDRAAVLSGGQKRRLHTAMALIGHPPLLLLDEPTAGADVETRAQLLDLVASRAADGTAVVYSTHYLPEVEQLRAEVVIIDRGRIRASGPLDTLVARYQSSRLELTLSAPMPTAMAERFGAEGGDGRVSIATTQPEADAAEILAGLPGTVTGLSIVRPSLESVYLEVLGRPAATVPQ